MAELWTHLEAESQIEAHSYNPPGTPKPSTGGAYLQILSPPEKSEMQQIHKKWENRYANYPFMFTQKTSTNL